MVPLAFFSCTWTDLLLEWTPVLAFQTPIFHLHGNITELQYYNMQYTVYTIYKLQNYSKMVGC